MEMSGVTILLIIFGLIIVAFAAYSVMSHLKGSISLLLPNTSYSYGDTINGSFTLLAKKSIEGNRLYASLTARETTKTYDKDGKQETRSREVYNTEKLIESTKTYPQGFEQNYSFQLSVPDSNSKGVPNSAIGEVMSVLGNIIDGRDKYIEWNVEVYLDAKGVDLKDSEKIYVGVAASN